MELIVIGINHKTSNVEQRESYQIGRKELPVILNTIYNIDGIEGVLILSTCNRIEFYLTIGSEINCLECIKKVYFDIKKISDFNEALFYEKKGAELTYHLFKVISGLDSLVFGEYQIQGQLKEAYSIACEAKTVDKYLHKLLHAAFRTGKKIRSQTVIGEGKQSISGVAAEIIISNTKPKDTITIIGVNENSRILATELVKHNYERIIFANRTRYKAEILAEEFGGIATSLDLLERNLFDSEVVFSSTGAPGFIVSSEMLKRLYIQEHCPRLIVDMAIPRDIDTTNIPDSVLTYDISALQHYLEGIKQEKASDLPSALKIIEEEVNIFQAWSDTQSSDLFEPFAEKFELARIQIIDEYKNKFSDQSIGTVDKLTKQLIHRLQSSFVNILLKQQNSNNI